MRIKTLVVVAVGILALGPTGSALAQDGPGDPDIGNNWIDVSTDDDSATADVEGTVPGAPGVSGSSGSGGPNCTKSDGTRDYLSYEGLMVTTMEEQRTEIRPEEQRPGVYLHVSCGDEYVGFRFFPEGPPAAPIDPRVLADSVTITPAAPVIRTSPDAGRHLVNLEAWFWTTTWQSTSATATAGPVSVRVSAQPTALRVDPGDGSAPFTCAGRQPAYDPDRPAASQSSSCTYTYRKAGHFTATATIVYGVSFRTWTNGVEGVGGELDTIESDATQVLDVRESQAIVSG